MKKKNDTTKVMIAGIGGASLGTEIAKTLTLAGGYEIYGCDVSRTAYGLYEQDFTRTWRISCDGYLDQVLGVCRAAGVDFLIPGGEQPMLLLGAAQKMLADNGIKLVTNSPEVISLCSNKNKTFRQLANCGIPIPRTAIVKKSEDIEHVGLPCIIKPATNSGGSVSVFFVKNQDEAMIYASLIRRNGDTPIAQEYIDETEGEFTIGVLSLPDELCLGSIAMQRILEAKLSIAFRGSGGVISSGYSQGYIRGFPNICEQAERIAQAIQSRGPINIQGRLRDGVLFPFEINPRFSASTFLRAMAGFNEVDMVIKYFINGKMPRRPVIKPGLYLRSLAEKYVAMENVK